MSPNRCCFFLQTSVEELYISFSKAYALLDMTNKANPTSEIYERVEEQKSQMRKIICIMAVLIRDKGNSVHEFQLYIKRKKITIFPSQFGLGMNLYMYMNQIQDFLETADLVGRTSLRSLIL
jgi:hypothetical protein